MRGEVFSAITPITVGAQRIDRLKFYLLRKKGYSWLLVKVLKTLMMKNGYPKIQFAFTP